jgi:hypothetical protein
VSTELTFSAVDVAAPYGSDIPDADDLRSVAAVASDLGAAGRVRLMNQIGRVLNIPPGGWNAGQTKLFVDGDVRLWGMLRPMSRQHHADLVAANLARAAQVTGVNHTLALVTANRENARSLIEDDDRLINSFNEGGLDHLWSERKKLGLPSAVTDKWERIEPFKNKEVNGKKKPYVYPARIQARDQVMVYAAQVGASFRNNFKKSVTATLGGDAEAALGRASRSTMLVWQALAFLAPGGREFDPKQPLSSQLGQHFGQRSVLEYIAHVARASGRRSDLGLVITDSALNHLAWVRSAKIRAAETLFLECLLRKAREPVLW